jgi:hypothetical protein
VTTNGTGNASFTITPSTPVLAGQFVTSLATDAGLTSSKFSACAQVIAAPSPPTSFIEANTNQVATVDSVTLVRSPFTLTDNFNFSSDHRTRIIFFTTNLGFNQPSQPDVGTLSVEVGGFSLAVESVGPTSFAGLDASYIVFRLPDLPAGDWPLSIRLRGVNSTNSPTLKISGP